jgi:predicted MFS family arabinose efflux permease
MFELGMFVFVLLYNLRLGEVGFREDVLGRIAGAATAGIFAAVLPAGMAMRRWRPETVLRVSFLGLAGVSMVRVLARGEHVLVASAFAAGGCLSLWFVAMAPTVTALTAERGRQAAFSLFFASGIALGVLGGAVGGQLPGWMKTMGARQPMQAALLAACALIGLAGVALRGLRVARPPREPRTFSVSPFLFRFLVAIAVWGVAMGAFNPFFNAYFSQHLQFSVERIGWIFAIAQLTQAAAVLAAPRAYRRFGLVKAIAGMQAITGAALAVLAVAPAAFAAGAYIALMSFQYMSEPGMYTLLMNGVRPGERNGASALHILVLNAAQSGAAACAGVAFARHGYPMSLGVAGATAVLAAILFQSLLKHREDRSA